MKKTLKFQVEKETKGAYRFMEVGSSVLQTIYVRKDALGAEKPEKLSITIDTGAKGAKADKEPADAE